jgi:c-di-GMP-binding flagellar brake protein YcgR
MKFEDMKLTYGYPLQLQSTNSAGQPERFSCRLIGCLPGRSILLSVPKVAGKLVRFRPGQKIVARLMVDNGIGIFTCTVDAQTADPYPILHIGYPDNVGFKGIRGATRVAIDQQVEITNITKQDTNVVYGHLVDISVTGARIELNTDVGELGDRLQLSVTVDIAGIVRHLVVDAIIRSHVENNPQATTSIGSIAYGVEFVEKDEDKRLLLYAYVYAQIGNDEVVS